MCVCYLFVINFQLNRIVARKHGLCVPDFLEFANFSLLPNIWSISIDIYRGKHM